MNELLRDPQSSDMHYKVIDRRFARFSNHSTVGTKRRQNRKKNMARIRSE